MKLNVGCGTDYREGFVNIDGSTKLKRVDKIIDISSDTLLNHFRLGEVTYILANDIIEHHYHWEAVKILTDFYKLLGKDGKVEIRVPDAARIISSWRIPMERKLTLLYGGQDIPQKTDLEMDNSRKDFPQYFCHKYGWTKENMSRELAQIGFVGMTFTKSGTNFITKASKP